MLIDIEKSRLADMLGKAREWRVVLDSRRSTPNERAQAYGAWIALYRAAHASAEALEYLESIAQVSGLHPLRFYLWEFQGDFAAALLSSADMQAALEAMLLGQPGRGPKGRSYRERMEIAALVQRARDAGLTLDGPNGAAAKAAAASNPRIGTDAVRRIYEGAIRKPADAGLVRLLAAGEVDF